jgi:hypothetical protein
MPRLPVAHVGNALQVRGRNLAFSYWPMYKTTRFGLQSLIFSANPWAIISSSIQKSAPPASKAAAAAFVSQSEDFFRAATTAGVAAAKPVLLYYCFLNLVKAYLLHIGQCATLDNGRHGLSEQLRPGGAELTGAFLKGYPTTARETNIFHEFLLSVRGTGLAAQTDFDLPHILPQIVAGHRLWCVASAKRERFIAIHRIEFVEHKPTKRLWARIFIYADDLSRLGITHQGLLTEARLTGSWREVKIPYPTEDRRLLCFEQINTVAYQQRPSDAVPGLVASLRKELWAVITSVPPYRRYYLYLAPAAEAASVLPQTVSLYALMYYLGSVTRYRPHHFDRIVADNYGAHILELITNQPTQFIYLLASDFAGQEVTRPAIV